MNAQPIISAAVKWFFRGVERKGTEFEDMTIHGTTETLQVVNLGGTAFFDVSPESDEPSGLALALDYTKYKDASDEEQRATLEAFAAINNPLTNAPDTVACVACHTSTVALATRADELRVDPSTLSGRYTTSFDVSIGAGMAATTDRTLRALGWLGTAPMISERVAHDTALVLEDIALHYQSR
jgi:hypothetical protein